MNESVRQLFLRFPELWGICPTFGIQEEPLTAKLTVFKNAFVFGIDCWALSSGNAAIRPPSMSSTMLRPYLFNHRFQCSKQPVSEYDEALYCGGPNSLNHYHFIYDALPWIISCHDIQPVVNCRLGKAQIDILRTFNIKPNVVSNPNVTKVQTLTVPCNKFWSLNDRLQFLRGLLSIGNIPFKPSKLYIKRSASRRSILNASALETALNSKGFSSINPEELSLREQLEYVANADVIVTAHGAATANLFVAKTTCQVIELMPTVGWGISTHEICQALRLHHHIIECHNRGSNMIVNVEKVISLL